MTGKRNLRPVRPGRTSVAGTRYFAVDGGAGAHVLAALAGLDPRLTPVDSVRHAEVLLVFAPIQARLIPAVVAVAAARPAATAVLIVDGPVGATGADLVAVLPAARPIPQATPVAIQAGLRAAELVADLPVPAAPRAAGPPILLPGRQEREIATELAVLSLGPLQPFTAGPLRLLLICDGEQVLAAQVDAGYARRDVAAAMTQATWRTALDQARTMDPLAPLAGQLAYVQALEHLQGRVAPEPVQAARGAVLAWERASNHLWWLLRFAGLLALDRLAVTAHRLATALQALGRQCWPGPSTAWIQPQAAVPFLPTRRPEWDRLARDVAALGRQLQGDRWLALRTRGIGGFPLQRLMDAGIDGPVAHAAREGAGDVQSRLTARLAAAAQDIAAVATAVAATPADPGRSWVAGGAQWGGRPP